VQGTIRVFKPDGTHPKISAVISINPRILAVEGEMSIEAEETIFAINDILVMSIEGTSLKEGYWNWKEEHERQKLLNLKKINLSMSGSRYF